jgi:hypothetical protein
MSEQTYEACQICGSQLDVFGACAQHSALARKRHDEDLAWAAYKAQQADRDEDMPPTQEG